MYNVGQSLPKSHILSSYGRIHRLFAEGKGGFVYPLRYIVYAEPAEELSFQVLFSTPKKFHKRAVRRNLLRRRMREALRKNKEILYQSGLKASLEIALIYSSKEVHEAKLIENAIKKILSTIAETA